MNVFVCLTKVICPLHWNGCILVLTHIVPYVVPYVGGAACLSYRKLSLMLEGLTLASMKSEMFFAERSR